MKLISMTDFVLQQEDLFDLNNSLGREFELRIRYNNNFKYAKFLKQPLKLEMFVPCDEDGEALEQPKCNICYTGTPDECHRSKECSIDETPFLNFKKAKDKVIFNGWKVIHSDKENSEFEIENLDKNTWIKFIEGKCFFGISEDLIIDDIEDLELVCHVELTISESAIKKIGL